MSYTARLKDELAQKSIQKDCCRLAELAAFFRSAGETVLLSGGRFVLSASTESEACAGRIISLCKSLGDQSPELVKIVKRQPRRMTLYRLQIDSPALLSRLGAYAFGAAPLLQFTDLPCCRTAALRGAFLGCGMLADPHKQYRLEFLLYSEASAEAITALLAGQAIPCNRTTRNERELVYIKDSESVVRLCGLMGASKMLLDLENVRVLKDVRNRVNRRNNCDTANIDKTVNASVDQCQDIRLIAEKAGLKTLSPALYEIAVLRLQKDDASLAELAAEIGISRSAVNNRLRKIREIAASLK